MENSSLLRYITCDWYQTCAINDFSIFYVNEFGTFLPLRKGFFTVLFSDNKPNIVNLLHRAQRKHNNLVKMKEKSKSTKSIS